jgi:hypothetical protein
MPAPRCISRISMPPSELLRKVTPWSRLGGPEPPVYLFSVRLRCSCGLSIFLMYVWLWVSVPWCIPSDEPRRPAERATGSNAPGFIQLAALRMRYRMSCTVVVIDRFRSWPPSLMLRFCWSSKPASESLLSRCSWSWSASSGGLLICLRLRPRAGTLSSLSWDYLATSSCRFLPNKKALVLLLSTSSLIWAGLCTFSVF